ncbi:phosphatase PAP2 family protein [Lacticaseibacillus paracasei]|uniref:phosphatase PAP2 family protein n=1 Tax=Lacticaseibacillus paracasei TaxID=1597 RepID=UPI0030EF9C78
MVWLQQEPVVSLWFAGLQLGGSAITEGFKLLIDRSRPLHQLVLDHGASFPSGHTFCTALLVFTLWTLCLPHIQGQETQLITVLIGIGWIAMVAISRVYLRDHYLSDVLASVCLASGWWLLVTPAEAFIQAKMRQFLPEGMLKSWPHQN